MQLELVTVNLSPELNKESVMKLSILNADNMKTVLKTDKKKQNVYPKSTPIAFKMALFLGIFCFFSLTPSANAKPSMSLPQFSERSATLSRFVNGLYLGQSLSDGTLDKRQLIDELFYLGPNVTFDSLSKSDFGQLVKNLETIQNSIGAKCTGDNGCGLSTSITDKMEKVTLYEEIIPILQEALKPLNDDVVKKFNDLNALVRSISPQLEKPGEISNQIDTLVVQISKNNFDDARLEAESIIEAIKEFSHFFDSLKTGSSVINDVFGSVLNDIKTGFNSILPIYNISLNYISQYNAISPLKTAFTSQMTMQEELIKTLETKKINVIILNLDVLSSLSFDSKSTSKNLIAGFPNGLDDIKSVMTTDGGSPWLKNLLNSGKNLTLITSKLVPLKNLVQQLSPLQAVFLKMNPESAAHSSQIKHLISGKEKVFTELSKLSEEYSKCMKDLKRYEDKPSEKKPDAPGTEPLMLLNNFKTGIDLFLNENNTMNSVEQFSESLHNNLEALDQLNLPNGALVTTVKTALGTLATSLTQINYTHCTSWFDNNQIRVFESNQKWINTTHLLPVLECTKSTKSSETLLEYNPLAKSLGDLNPQNKDVESIKKLAKSLEDLVKEWKRIKSTLSKTGRSKRDAALDFKNAKTAAKDLGDISTIIRKLSEMLKMESDLTTLIQESSTIDSTIDGITDLEKKDQLKKMWSQEAIDVLKTNLETAKKVSGEVSKMEEVKNIFDFKTPFDIAAGAEESQIDFKDLADALNGKITDQDLAASLESLKSIDLTFASYQKTKIGKVLRELEAYFNSIFVVKPSADAEKKKKKTSSDSESCEDEDCFTGYKIPETPIADMIVIFLLAGIFILFLVALFAIGRFLYFLRKYRKEKEEASKQR